LATKTVEYIKHVRIVNTSTPEFNHIVKSFHHKIQMGKNFLNCWLCLANL